MTVQGQQDQLKTLEALNAAHLEQRPELSDLTARIKSYELAFQLQTSAPEAMDLSQEGKTTLENYGLF